MTNIPPQPIIGYTYLVVYVYTEDDAPTRELTGNHSLTSRFPIESFQQVQDMTKYIQKEKGFRTVVITDWQFLERNVATFETTPTPT